MEDYLHWPNIIFTVLVEKTYIIAVGVENDLMVHNKANIQWEG